MDNWLIIFFRTIILFFLTLIISKILGKENLSKLTPFKFISYIVIGIIVSLITLGIVPNMAFAFLTLGMWFLFSLGLDYLAVKSKLVHDFIRGKEIVLVKNGKVMEENLMKERLTGEELLRELRTKNAFSMADVEFAVMEATGDINVLLKSDKTPLTPHDLKRKVAPVAEPETIILDGNILDESLTHIGLNREWLNIQLSNAGVSLDNVFIAQVNTSGELYIDLFDDLIQLPQPKVKEMLYASLSKVQSDFISYSLQTKNVKAKEMYSRDAMKLKEILNKLEPYLLR